MQALFDVRGKVALVTGGAHGLGRMIADGLVRAGARVYFTTRKPEALQSAERAMQESGWSCGIAADLTNPEAASRLVGEIKDRERELHILINNAGRTWGAPIAEFPDKAWAPVMAVNVQGPFTLVRELLPLLKTAATAEDPARVINIGSLAGLRVQPISAFSYAASKAAIHHLSRVLAAELAADHVTVNTVIPGYFPTQMTAHIRAQEGELQRVVGTVPLGRLGAPDDIVGACIYLASRAGRYLTGAEIVLDGGIAGCT